jgi:tetratricopeptide (TPR) repeat protein
MADEHPELQPLLLETVRRVRRLWDEGQHRAALKLLNDVMAQPGEDQGIRVRCLSSLAQATAYLIGDFQLVRHYCQQRLAFDPEDCMALYSLANSYALQGDLAQARKYAARCYDICCGKDDVNHRELSQILLERFPDLKRTN